MHKERAMNPTLYDVRITKEMLSNYNLTNKKVVVVAGTNGKGSTSAFLGHLLHHAGKSVGVYINPVRNDYNDQFWKNGSMVSVEECGMASFRVSCIEKHLDTNSHDLLVAMELFKDVEYIVIEVTAGGKDAEANLLEPDVSILTNVGLDHTYFLGKTIDQIGLNKAHVFRPNKPAVIGDGMPNSVIEYANSIGANIVEGNTHTVTGVGFPPHNASVAIEAALQLGVDITDEHIEKAVGTFDLLGYFTVFDYKGAKIVIDIAHNADAVDYFVDRVKNEIDLSGGKVYAMVAFHKRKFESFMLMTRKLAEIADEFILPETGLFRLLRPSEGCLLAKEVNKPYVIYCSVEDALSKMKIESGDTIVVCGSYYFSRMRNVLLSC